MGGSDNFQSPDSPNGWKVGLHDIYNVPTSGTLTGLDQIGDAVVKDLVARPRISGLLQDRIPHQNSRNGF